MSQVNSKSQGLLIFNLTATQTFALGTLKVREIVPYQPLTVLPHSHHAVVGSASIRGITMPVIDIASAVNYRPLQPDEIEHCHIIVTDCLRQKIGFLVRGIDRIVEAKWQDILPPPSSVGRHAFVAGLTEIEGKLVQLLDLEHVVADIFPLAYDECHATISDTEQTLLSRRKILVVDDSSIARKQLADAMDKLGIEAHVCVNGQEALNTLQAAVDQEVPQPFDIIVSDIEMPGLDGYELTFEVRSNRALENAYIILHTSLSSEISVDQAHQVGANEALTKFNAQELIDAMLRGARKIESNDVTAGVEGARS